jgi:hypothetical protein
MNPLQTENFSDYPLQYRQTPTALLPCVLCDISVSQINSRQFALCLDHQSFPHTLNNSRRKFPYKNDPNQQPYSR